MAYLPEDLVLKIFAKLPAKPLGRLKCLSKHWNHLISDPYFMNTIRSRQMTLLVIDSFHAMDNRDHSIAKLCSPCGNSKIEDVVIAGTFNGIVLLILEYRNDNDKMILYNPCTGVFTIVPDPDPDPPLVSSSSRSSESFSYGFGYGTTPDDLKIVRLGACCMSKSCEVFSLKSGSWSTPSELIIRDYAIFQYGGTDNENITRKRSKPDKHEHENG
ncbi:F-box domain containing protein [Tanacetum coccineum]